jgi:hypothetical protein
VLGSQKGPLVVCVLTVGMFVVCLRAAWGGEVQAAAPWRLAAPPAPRALEGCQRQSCVVARGEGKAPASMPAGVSERSRLKVGILLGLHALFETYPQRRVIRNVHITKTFPLAHPLHGSCGLAPVRITSQQCCNPIADITEELLTLALVQIHARA